MKKDLLIIGITFLVITGLFSGCTQSDIESVGSDQIQNQVTPPVTESVKTILEKTDTIGSMYYEIIASIEMSQFGSQEALLKIWKNDLYFKEEIIGSINGMSSTISVIHRPEGTYIYDTTQGKYVLTTNDVSSLTTVLEYFDSSLIMSYLENQTLSDFETEQINGKEVTHIQYVPIHESDFIMVDLWIWNEKGVPLKANVDMALEETAMCIDFTFTNYSFVSIPDSIFSID